MNLLLLAVSLHVPLNAQTYEPTWDSVDKHPIPTWFSCAKFGIFIHRGEYPSMRSALWASAPSRPLDSHPARIRKLRPTRVPNMLQRFGLQFAKITPTGFMAKNRNQQ